MVSVTMFSETMVSATKFSATMVATGHQKSEHHRNYNIANIPFLSITLKNILTLIYSVHRQPTFQGSLSHNTASQHRQKNTASLHRQKNTALQNTTSPKNTASPKNTPSPGKHAIARKTRHRQENT